MLYPLVSMVDMGSCFLMSEFFKLFISIFQPLYGKSTLLHHFDICFQVTYILFPMASSFLLFDIIEVRITEQCHRT